MDISRTTTLIAVKGCGSTADYDLRMGAPQQLKPDAVPSKVHPSEPHFPMSMDEMKQAADLNQLTPLTMSPEVAAQPKSKRRSAHLVLKNLAQHDDSNPAERHVAGPSTSSQPYYITTRWWLSYDYGWPSAALASSSSRTGLACSSTKATDEGQDHTTQTNATHSASNSNNYIPTKESGTRTTLITQIKTIFNVAWMCNLKWLITGQVVYI